MIKEYHKDLGMIKVLIEWEGHDKRFAFVSSNKWNRNLLWKLNSITGTKHKGYVSAIEHFYCLWGPIDKPITKLTSIECVTEKGNIQKRESALKLFWQLIKSAEYVTIK